jgi:hypothetical protein
VPLFSDAADTATMFRIVVKSNLKRTLAMNLLETIREVLVFMGSLRDGYEVAHHHFVAFKQACTTRHSC